MKTATQQLIELAEFLSPTGDIGDGTVAHFHELAARARVEQKLPPPCTRGAARDEARERYESECG